MLNLNVTFKPSWYYLILISIFLLMSMLVLLTITIQWECKLLGLLGLIIYGQYLLRFGLLCRENAILGIVRNSAGEWWVQTKHVLSPAQLQGDSWVTSWVIVLRFRVDNKHFIQSSIIFRDSLAFGNYRRLLVALFATRY